MFGGRRDDAAGQWDAADDAVAGRDDDDYVRSWVQSMRVGISLFSDEEDEEIAQGRLAMSLAERTGNPSMLSLASFGLGWALRHRYPAEALAAFDRCVALPGAAQ